MPDSPKLIAGASLLIVAALYVVGAVSHSLLRHVVQTIPLWFPIVWGYRRSDLAKWSALPCFVFWLVIMSFIWLFLLGWGRILNGHFSPAEVVMTVVVGLSCLAGIRAGLRWRTATPGLKALGLVIVFAVFQVVVMRISYS